MANASRPLVRFEKHAELGVLILDNPPENRINRSLYGDLDAAAREAVQSGCRALLLRGEGSDFCFGGDFTEWSSLTTHTLKRERFGYSNGILQTLESLPIPTVAAVHGRAFGGGFELAMHTDLIICAQSARFRFPEVTLGVSPLAGGVQRVAERAGRAAAAALVMLSEEISAEQAERLNIVAKVVPDQELEQTGLALARKLSTGPTRAHVVTKLVLSAWSTGGVRAADEVMIEAVCGLLATEDAEDAVAAAIEARGAGKPRPDIGFKGR